LWPAAAAREQQGTTARDAIERYRRVAKALVQAGAPGEGSQDLATRRLGLPLEIVLARPPADAGDDNALTAHVLFEGRPLARLGEEEGLAVGEIDVDLVEATRARHTMVHDHRAGLGNRIRA